MNFTEAFAKCISHNRHFQIDFCIGSGIMILTSAFKSFFVCLFQIDNVYSTYFDHWVMRVNNDIINQNNIRFAGYFT